jgi:transposase
MFYATLPSPARVGMEATCDAPWFEGVLQEHHHELWIGDAAEGRAAMAHVRLLLPNPHIWVPALAERDLRQMLRHRHKLVRFRTSVMNQLHALAIGQGLCRKKKLWTKVGRKELEGLVLDPWASRRRQELLLLLDQLDPWIAKLDEAVIQAAESRPAGWRGAGNGTGVCADHRASEPLCEQ